MPAAAILQFALQLLPLITTGENEFILWLHTLRHAAQEAGEWTEAQDQDFAAKLAAKESAPAYQPDPPAAGPAPTIPAA